MVQMSMSSCKVSIYIQNVNILLLFLAEIVILCQFLRYSSVNGNNQNNRNTEAERHLFNRILKYTGVFGGVQGISMLVTLILTKVKSVLLGPVGYGITENLNRSADLIRNSTNLGLATVAVPEISRGTNETGESVLQDKIMLTRSWALLTAIIGMIVCVALAPLLSRWAFGGDRSYTFSFVALSMAVAAAAVTGGETAVLRGTGMLRQIALSQLFIGVVSLCVSVPLYWFLRFDGIVPALVLSSLGSTGVTCFYSCRRFPYKVHPFRWGLLREGTGMIGFGLFFTVAAFLSAWAWSFIARYLTEQGGTELTGSYSAGYMLVTYLTTLLLSVTDSEYYPRLSAAGDDLDEAHRIMNNQVLAMCMLAAPLVILFMLCVPIVVLIVLEYEKFQASIVLAQMAVVGLFFKSVYQPISYLVLARSDSKIYVIQEAACYILLIISVVLGYRSAGIIGLGVSFAVWELLYLVMVLVISRVRYGFRMTSSVVSNFLIQGVLVILTAACVLMGSRIWQICSIVLCVASMSLSLRFFLTHTTFLSVISSKLFRKS